MRNPIKITMIGNNGEKYNFLIKFGEDLRQDQRIQQLHKVINDSLSNNAYCCDRQLSLLTYIVRYYLFFCKFLKLEILKNNYFRCFQYQQNWV